MAEHMFADSESLFLLLDWLSLEQAVPLMCAGVCLGSLGVQFAKALGHPVVAIDDRCEAMTLAQELTLKANLAIDCNDSKTADKIRYWTGNGGLAAIVVRTDNMSAILWCIQAVSTRGICGQHQITYATNSI